MTIIHYLIGLQPSVDKETFVKSAKISLYINLNVFRWAQYKNCHEFIKLRGELKQLHNKWLLIIIFFKAFCKLLLKILTTSFWCNN